MICLPRVVVYNATWLSNPSRHPRATEEKKVFLEAEKYEFLYPTFLHVVVKMPQTAGDV